MGEGLEFLDIILLAMVAAFVLLRLRGVLGRRTGHEQRNPRSRISEDPAKTGQDDNVVNLPESDTPEPEPGEPEAADDDDGTPLEAVLRQIALVDSNFEQAQFLDGAGAAYEMIVTDFAAGDTKSLKPYLSDRVFENFNSVIDARKTSGQIQETTLVSINDAEIVEAELKGRTVEITVKFVSEMINVTRDTAGAVIGGDPSKVAAVVDFWTFARNTRSSDPNWSLIATRSSN
jgi:predicted lipid-binding transport protein (Tim44 family)